MKFSYKFSNLLGTVYRDGNVEFLPKTDTLASPVGNRITLFDLKKNQSNTLPMTTKYDIRCLAFSPDGCMVIVTDERGEASLMSLLYQVVVHRFQFGGKVRSIKYSPDGKKFAVAMEKVVLVYHSPGKTREINPFVLYRAFHGAYDEVTSLDWTDDSSAFVAGGVDMNTRVCAAKPMRNLNQFSLGGHKDEVVGCFFEKNSLDVYTVSKDGALNIWECDTDLENLVTAEKGSKDENVMESSELMKQVCYSQVSKYFFNKEGDFNTVTSVAFHKHNHILAVGFASGSFSLHELPFFNLIHSLNISEQEVSTISFNKTGDWLALGCPGYGQLLVWEWQSEMYILKQQGHFNNMRCLDYSPDGGFIATGGEDGKVKVWDTSTGFCFITFTEHTAAITGVSFTSNGSVIISSSLDGTIRAFDMHRYRNFRTFTSPRPIQFVSLAVDHSGDVIAAGSHDTFEILLWSMKTSRLLEILSGHEAPVVSLCFSSREATLASGSLDGTVKLWNIIEGKGAKETLQIDHDVLAVSFNPDGSELAVSSLNAQISFWDVQNSYQKGYIECKYDIKSGRREVDRTSAKTNSLGLAHNTISYTADGEAIIAGGKFPMVHIYSVKECLLLKNFKITQNLSFDASEEFLSKRKMTEFGPKALIDMSETGPVAIKLPGVQKGDMCSREYKPEVRVLSIKFSPTGREWSAVTTEGLLIYSLDANQMFDPYNLDVDVNPISISDKMKNGDFVTALMMAFRLNENQLITQVFESVPISAIDVISSSLPYIYVEKLLAFISKQLEESKHVQFYMTWARHLLLHHSVHLKPRSGKIMHVVNQLSKSMNKKKDEIASVCDVNKYQLEYVLSLSKHLCCKRSKSDEGFLNSDEETDEDMSDLN